MPLQATPRRLLLQRLAAQPRSPASYFPSSSLCLAHHRNGLLASTSSCSSVAQRPAVLQCPSMTIPSSAPLFAASFFSTAAPRYARQLPPRPKPPPEEEMSESYIKGSGPGGQKINKTNCAVQLIHHPTGIVVKCQATRSREQNRTEARRIMATKLDNLMNGNSSREALVAKHKAKLKKRAHKKAQKKHEQASAATDNGEDNNQKVEREGTDGDHNEHNGKKTQDKSGGPEPSKKLEKPPPAWKRNQVVRKIY